MSPKTFLQPRFVRPTLWRRSNLGRIRARKSKYERTKLKGKIVLHFREHFSILRSKLISLEK